jgi:hypothetical protein
MIPGSSLPDPRCISAFTQTCIDVVGRLGAGVACIDYNEHGANTASPSANVQGPGGVALPGCNFAAANSDACQGATAPKDAFGSAVLESF